MFSAVIPTKDNSSSLSRALLSTKNKNIVERIVVTDSYLSITPNPLADKWLSNYKQLGPGIARNKGILEAKGDFLLFLDSDDEFYLTGIEKVADYINCFNGKPPDIVVFDWKIFVAFDKSTPSSFEQPKRIIKVKKSIYLFGIIFIYFVD